MTAGTVDCTNIIGYTTTVRFREVNVMRRLAITACLALLTALAAAPAFPTVFVKCDSAGPIFDGASWETAYNAIQPAIDKAALTQDQVWAAAGTYPERLQMKQGVALYGGFAGGETTLGERNCKANHVVVDGEMRGACVTVPSGLTSTTRVDGMVLLRGTAGGGIYCDHSSPTIVNNIIAESAASGVYCNYGSPIIINNCIMGNSAGSWAGGIRCNYSSGLIANNFIYGNSGTQGGGIGCYHASPTITNNTICYNNAMDYGGGISYLDGSYPAVSNNIIAFNSSGVNAGAAVTFRNNCVFGNRLSNYRGVSDQTGLNGNIGADPIFVDNAFADLHIQPGSPCRNAGSDADVQAEWLDIDSESRIQGTQVDIGADESDNVAHSFTPYIVRVATDGNDTNDGQSWASPMRTTQAAVEAASIRGGEVWARAGVFEGRVMLRTRAYLYGGFAGTETTRDERNWIANRTILDAKQAGATVWARAGYTLCGVDGFTVTGGKGLPTGGGFYLDRVSPTVANNLITGNTAGDGGGLYTADGYPTVINNTFIANTAGNGGAIFAGSAAPLARIVNNTIVGNSASFGGGVRISGGELRNNIIAFNSSGISCTNGDVSNVLDSNCVYGNRESDYRGLAAASTDIRVDPLLASGDYGDLHIQPTSPCRDRGGDLAASASWVDMDMQPRIQGSHVDIGRDESDGTTRAVSPRVIRVSPDGSDGNDGASWQYPMATVQGAIDSAAATGAEIWVRSGVYRERITMRPSEYLYGGFRGNETSRSERDYKRNETVLDGGRGGSVVTATSVATLGAIDGFTIRNGTGTLVSGERRGGGIYCNSSPVIANNTITGNKSDFGGGIYCPGHTAVITRNRISHNAGTGIACSGYASHQVTDNIIESNSGYWGGGIHSEYSFCRFERNVISHNSTERYGGGVCASDTGDPVPVYANNLIANNVAATGGGMCIVQCAPLVRNNTIASNTAAVGGGIAMNAASPSITNNIVAFGSSGIYSTGTGPTLRDNDVFSNGEYDYSGVTAGAGDISSDPLFLAPWVGEYHVLANSPCANAGLDSAVPTGSTDLQGNPRISGGHVDMGCLEWCALPCPLDRASQAKGIPEGVKITLTGKPVTAAFEGAFYIEDYDRCGGIRVLSTEPVSPGQTATVMGQMVLDSGERALQAISLSTSEADPARMPQPLAMPCRSVGGGEFFWLEGGALCGQQGITGSCGMNNIGLLVRVTGFASTDAGGTWLDDGSGMRVRCLNASEPFSGHVTIRGIASCEPDGESLRPALRVISTEPR